MKAELAACEQELENNKRIRAAQRMEDLLSNPNRVIVHMCVEETYVQIIAFEFCGEMLGENVVEIQLFQIYDDGTEDANICIHMGIQESVLTIHEIQVPPGFGWGSMLMEYVFKYADAQNVDKICAPISSVDFTDLEHMSRLQHFYEKHGFTISDTKQQDWKVATRILHDNEHAF